MQLKSAHTCFVLEALKTKCCSNTATSARKATVNSTKAFKEQRTKRGKWDK
jgi:hypothetical protein